MSESANKALIRIVMTEVFGNGRLDVIDEVYVPSIAGNVRGLVSALRAGFPDLAIEIDHLIEEGDKLACRWNASGTQQGWFHGVPPTGARVTWTGTSIYGIADGRIIAVLSNWDLFGVLQQLRSALR